MAQPTGGDRLAVIHNLLKLTLPLADTVDPVLAAFVCQAIYRAEALRDVRVKI